MNCFLKKIRWMFGRIELIVALSGFAALLLDPIRNEYIYEVLAGKKQTNYCSGGNDTLPGESFNEDVSRWTLYLDLALFIPASIAGVFITSWGDKVGRKPAMVIPLVTMTTGSVIFALAIQFKWPIEALLLVNLCGGAGGYYMVLLMQGVAYLSDVTTAENRGLRFLILETCLGLSAGAAGIASGYWVKAMGLFNPIFSTAILNLISLFLVGALPDSIRTKQKFTRRSSSGEASVSTKSEQHLPDNRFLENSSESSTTSLLHTSGAIKRSSNPLDLLKSVKLVYTQEFSPCEQCFGPEEGKIGEACIHGGGIRPGRVWRMWVYVGAYNLFMFVNVGTMVFQTFYFLSPPLCFSQVLVGIQLAVKYIGVALSPFFVWFYQRVLHIGNNLIVLLGLIALMVSNIVIAMATDDKLVLIGTAIMAFSLSSKSFIQAQLSNLVSEWEQGSAFAFLSFSESLTMLLATVAFLLLYPVTSPLFHGFVWLLAAGVSLCSIILVTTVYVIDRQQKHKIEKRKTTSLN